MRYKLTTLANGLRLITVPMPNLESATITVWVGVGSRYEHDEHAGLSHFLEHAVFKGTKKRPSAEDVSLALDSLGAESNAGTAREYTNFYIKAASGTLERAFDILADLVLYPLLKEKDIEREKGVILEELAMYEDTPIEKIGDIFANLIFAGNTLGRDIIGTRKTIKGLKKADFERYRSMHYVSANMLVTVAGNVNEKNVNKLAGKYFGKLKKGEKEETEKFKDEQKNPRLKLEYKKSEQAHLIIGYPGLKRNDPMRYAEGLLATVLGRGKSSRLFTEVREKRGLAYAVGCSVSHYSDTGIFATYAGVDPGKIEEALKIIIGQYEGISSGSLPVTEKELKKAKDYIKGRVALSLEDTASVNDFFGHRALFLPEIETPEQFFENLDKVELDHVDLVTKKIFNRKKLNLAIIGPYKSKAKFEKIIEN